MDTATFGTIQTIETGRGAHGVAIDPTGRHAYITNIYGDDVAVLDLDEMRIVARVAVGRSPNGISFSPTVTEAPSRIDVRLPAFGARESRWPHRGRSVGRDLHRIYIEALGLLHVHRRLSDHRQHRENAEEG